MRTRTTLALGLLAAAIDCSDTHRALPASAPQPPAQPLQVARVIEVSEPLSDEIVGTVRARNATAIAASVMGTVRALNVALGSRVRAGDVLVQLTAGEIDAKAAQAHAVLERANLDLKRADDLRQKAAIPSSAYDAAAAQQRIAETALAETEVMRGYMQIKSPIAGVVTGKQCEVGDLALPGRTLLTIESLGALRLEAAVPEALVPAVRRGELMPVRIDALERVVEGKVSELNPSAEAESRTVLVKLDLPAVPELRPGMFGRLSLHEGEHSELQVPRAAVVERGQMELVYVVKDNAASLRIVRTGTQHDDAVELLAGLEAGERVVIEHPERLVDGQIVQAVGP